MSEKHRATQPPKPLQLTKPVPSIKETVLKEQVDLSSVFERFDHIESALNDLAVDVKALCSQEDEINKKQLEVLGLFAQALKREVGK